MNENYYFLIPIFTILLPMVIWITVDMIRFNVTLEDMIQVPLGLKK